MGAGRRSVCFEQDALSSLLLPESVQTKNTFVHFESSPAARRATCVGIVTPVAEKPRAVARADARAVTCKPDCAVAQLVIPDLARRLSAASASDASDASTPLSCGSPTSPQTLCLETPSTLFVPSPRRAFVDGGLLGASPFASPCASPFASPFASPCASPCASPQAAPQPFPMAQQFLGSPQASPMMAPQQFPGAPQFQCSPVAAPQPFPVPMQPWPMAQPFPVAPFFQCMTPEMSPLPSPRDRQASAASEDFFPAVWQTLRNSGAVEVAPRQRRRQKVALPALAHELTLMLRHLPLALSPDELFAAFPADLLPAVDFYYLPTNFESKKNLGYAFLNFTDKAAAARFCDFWKASGIPESAENCVQDARVQGFAENLERFRNSSVMGVLAEDTKPKVFANGVPQPFPASARPLPPVGARFRPTGQ